MNAFKFSAVALALAASFSASAMTSIADAELSQVSGQDGVSIVADLNINIGSFTYTDNNGTTAAPALASVSFNNIDIKGMMIMTIDVLTNANFVAGLQGSLAAQGAASASIGNIIAGAANALGYVSGSDVVQFAFPVVTGAQLAARVVTPTITVASMTTGNGGASMGGIQIKNLDLQGTKVWMFGH